MEDIVIVGSSGFAKEIKALIKREGKYNFVGFIDPNLKGVSVVGDDNYLINCNRRLNVVIAIADSQIRSHLFDLYKKNSYLSFPNIIDPSAILFEDVTMGIGNLICAGNILTVGINIGNFNIMNLNCTVGHDALMGSFNTLNPNVNISGGVVLEDNVFIGTGTQILQGLSIGKNAVVGAGAVVVTDIPGNCTAVGVPAKIIKDRR